MSKIKGIKYIGPIFDGSGYAKACRGNILSLHKQGIPLTLSPISFDTVKPDLGEDGKILKSLVDKAIDYNVVIIHSTPEFWEKFREVGKVNIGYTIWETDKLHPTWSGYINHNVDKVLVGTEWNIDVFKKSGVVIPIGSVPHGICPNDSDLATTYDISGIDDDTYVFYSIFQWQERKDPVSLIKSYWYAFQNNEKVALVLKTYRGDYSDAEKQAIRTTITRLKQIAVLDQYPPIYLIPDMLTENEIKSLHNRGDCYVSLDKGEGFGLSPFQAGANGKPIIITGFGGTTEYAKEDNSYLINYTLEPVSGMPWSPWYRADQLWAKADNKHGADLMRHVYTHQEEAKEKGKKLQTYIHENFSHEVIGKKLISEIGEVL
jgi:glycosyltransferase involved in cell wall biosynthesis